MGNKENWIAEREEIALFRPDIGDASDAKALLEHSPTNRDITVKQSKLFTISRQLFISTGIELYNILPIELEKVQASVDNNARHDYMKVAIEQWQGKLANAKAKSAALAESLL
jgi:hypothetical protein